MNNDEGRPRSLGSKIKEVLGLSKPEEATTHKLGKSPVSLNQEILDDPEVKQVIENVRSSGEEEQMDYIHPKKKKRNFRETA